jgi:small subunit ribosomal protein S16
MKGGEWMSVKIRLNKMGAKKRPFYRLVVADSRAPRDGRFIEIIGHYNPIVDPVEIVVDKDKAQDWLKKGAKPSETVKRLLKKVGVIAEAASK